MRYKLCIFDFDLTLADSSVGILICFKHTLAAFGYPLPSDKTIYDTIGMTLPDAFDLLTGEFPNPRSEQIRVEYVKKADEEMVKNTIFYPEAVNILTALREAGVKVGVCSNKFRYRIADSFKQQAGCMPVDIIVGREDVAQGKPEPEGIYRCMENFGIDKDHTLYIGDNYIDAQTACNAGVDFAGVLTGSTTKEEFAKLPSVCIKPTLAELFAALNIDRE